MKRISGNVHRLIKVLVPVAVAVAVFAPSSALAVDVIRMARTTCTFARVSSTPAPPVATAARAIKITAEFAARSSPSPFARPRCGHCGAC